MRVALAVIFFAMQPLVATMFGCGSSIVAPPITLPAPTGGYMNTTAPDANGNVLVYGYIYSESKAMPGVDVDVTNATTSTAASTTTDVNAYFLVSIAASVGDNLKVKYTDPATGEESAETDMPVSNSRQPMSSATTLVHDVDYDSGTGYAVIVANDGTNSQIIEVNPSNGAIVVRASFSNVLFDKVSVHGGFNYAAVLDTTSNTLYWYDLANLADNMTPGDWITLNDEVHDVAVADLDDTPLTTSDLIVVSHDYNATNMSFLTTYVIASGGSSFFAGTAGCIPYPTDIFYPTCSAANDPALSRVTKIDFVKTADNWARLAMVAEYSGAKAAHFVSFTQIGNNALINTGASPGTAKYPHSAAIDASLDPYAIEWYNENIALMTNSATNALYKLDASTVGTLDVSSPLTVGIKPRGIATDSAGTRAFVANEDDNNVVNVNMASFALTGTSYTANYSPTHVIYYRDSATKKIGVALSEPEPMFGTIDITE